MLLERVSAHIVLKRRFTRKFGRAAVFVTPGAALRYWRFGLDGADPPLLRAAQEVVSSGSIVWDIIRVQIAVLSVEAFRMRKR
jgi:hypothetical protein